MKFSSKIRYGIRAMLEISNESSNVGVLQKHIAEKQTISVKYLDQIISSLKAGNLIINVNGKKSGYILTRKPSEISMLDIFNAFEGSMTVIDCLSDSVNCEKEEHCKSIKFWNNLNELMVKYFDSVSLQDLIEGNVPSEVSIDIR